MNGSWVKLMGVVAVVFFIFLSVLTTLTPATPLLASQPDADDVEIELIPIVEGFSSPIQVTHAGDGSDRLFVVEQRGTIKIVQNDTVLSTPFLDIDPRVQSGGERGLLGVAFHPNYQTNGYFYVNYTNNSGDTVIEKFEVSDLDPNVANTLTSTKLLTIEQPYSNHNGGQLLFGPNDGFLYIGMGDGGDGGDPQERAQAPDELLGKMLRIDVDSGSPYAIPPSNPFTQTAVYTDYHPEIWSLGLRNPWRFSFDRLTGDMYIGDVGQGKREEISFEPANSPGGLNFGWDCMEGLIPHGPDINNPPCNNAAFLSTLTPPIAEYVHVDDDQGYAVTGGYVYRGAMYPGLYGRYFFADHSIGNIWTITRTGTNNTDWTPATPILTPNLKISSFGEDEAGELYLLDRGQGRLYQIADASEPPATETPTSTSTSTATSTATPTATSTPTVPDLNTSSKTASADQVKPDDTVTYTIKLVNTGALSDAFVFLTDTVPDGLSYISGSLTASHGVANDIQNPMLQWQGALTPSNKITITYGVTVTGLVDGSTLFTGALLNLAEITGAISEPLTISETINVTRLPINEDSQYYLPLILRQGVSN